MSGKYCSVCRCRVSNIAMRRAPQDEERRKEWSDAIGASLNKFSTICENHFNESDFHYPESGGKKRKRLLNSAIPNAPFQYTEHTVSDTKPNTNDFSSQTEKEVVDCGIALENLRLKLRVSELEKENAVLKRKIETFEGVETSLNKIFTSSQIRQLASDGKRVRWNPEDVSYAICLHAAGPRAYKHLLKKGFPLPSERTLREWSQKLDVQPGTLDFVIELMENAIDVADEDKICVLSFEKGNLNSGNIQHSYVQLAMVHGLLKSWEQPIYFDYDTSMTVDILCDIMGKLYKAGYYVVAMVSSLVPMVSKLWNNLGVSSEQCWFTHPSNPDMKVFAFADASHLLQMVRNQFLDTGLLVENTILTSETIDQVIHHASSSDLSTMCDITPDHLTARGTLRRKLNLATELLSSTTAKAIRQCHLDDLDVFKATETADFVQLMNDWFEIFNSKLSNTVSVEAQRSVLDKMTTTMSVPLVPNANGCQPFQKGITVSNTSLIQLQEYLLQQYDIQNVFTNRLQQDNLHEFLEFILSNGTKFDITRHSDFKFRLRKYLLSKFGFSSVQGKAEQSVESKSI